MTDVVIQRRIAAPAATVYGFLTSAEKWVLWQGVATSLDPRVGGLFTIDMPNGTRSRGEFVEMEPNRRVVFTWGWIDHPGVPPGSTTVEILLEEDQGGTLLTLTHSGLPPEEALLHQEGWDHYLPRLARAAEGSDPGMDHGLQGNPASPDAAI